MNDSTAWERAAAAARDLTAQWPLRPGSDGGPTWAEATAPAALERWLERIDASDPHGPRPRAVSAAFLIGWLATPLLSPAVALAASGHGVPVLTPTTVFPVADPGGWVASIGLAPARLLHADDREAALRTLAAAGLACLAPVVAALVERSPLRPATLWGSVSDAAHADAIRLLAAGRHAAGLSLWWTAGPLAAELQRLAGLPRMRRPRLVGPPDQPRAVRGTCCLAYRSPAAHAAARAGQETRCAACPLRARRA